MWNVDTDQGADFVTATIVGPAQDGWMLCPRCGEELNEYGEGHASGCRFEGEIPDDSSLWCNSAGIDIREDAVSVKVSVGDPRGAFVMNVARVKTRDGEKKLRLTVPHPEDSFPHMGLRPLASPGYYEIVDSETGFEVRDRLKKRRALQSQLLADAKALDEEPDEMGRWEDLRTTIAQLEEL